MKPRLITLGTAIVVFAALLAPVAEAGGRHFG